MCSTTLPYHTRYCMLATAEDRKRPQERDAFMWKKMPGGKEDEEAAAAAPAVAFREETVARIAQPVRPLRGLIRPLIHHAARHIKSLEAGETLLVSGLA